MEKEKEVRCFIDDKEVDCKELQEQPLSDDEWIQMQTYGGGAET
tara:strand:+ start:244 stop:375 length:132 start_codon:yes stop_codon:yes gene_type:complete